MEPHAVQLAWEARDPHAFAACYSAQGEFHSPVIGDAGVIRGRHAIAELMKVVFASTSESEFVSELRDGDRLALRLRTKFNGRPAQGVLWLDLDPDGQVRESWAFVRPLTGVVAVSAALGPGLARRESRALGVGARVGLMPLLAMARLVDRIGTLLIRKLNRERSDVRRFEDA